MHRAARRCPRSDSIIHASDVGPGRSASAPYGPTPSNMFLRGVSESCRSGCPLPQRDFTRSRGDAGRSYRNVVPRGVAEQLPLVLTFRATCFHAEARRTGGGAENYPTGKPRVAGPSCPVRDPCTSAQFHSIHDFKAFDVAEPSSVRWREMLAEQPVAVAVAVPAPPRLRASAPPRLRASAWKRVAIVASPSSGSPRLRVQPRRGRSRPVGSPPTRR